jgi:hypothetical protein
VEAIESGEVVCSTVLSLTLSLKTQVDEVSVFFKD